MGMGLTVKNEKTMNRHLPIFILSALLLFGCEPAEQNDARQNGARVFHASMEEIPGVRTSVDQDLHLLWTKDDLLSIFTSTYNSQYRFTGNTGDNYGNFEEVAAEGFHSGSDISTNYAVYPYSSSTTLTNDEKLSLTMPGVQHYAANSFGPGANTMVAVTAGPSDKYLSFKNLCGYLVVRLYGEGSVKSVSIAGNNGEKIAGSATVTAAYGSTPSLEFKSDADGAITLDCGAGVALGADADHSTEFWFCIPPVTFSKGFTVTVVNASDATAVMKTSASRTVQRNTRVSMSPKSIQFKKSMPPAEKGYAETGQYRNYLKELGIPQEDIDNKIADIYSRIFENSETGAYFDVTVGNKKMGYVSDVKNRDVRSEGMSYGMMVAVQMNKPELFNRIWRWANYYMRHNDPKDNSYGLFAWSCSTDGRHLSEGSASDGELYFVTTLLLASRRWGKYEEFDYLEEAQTLLDQLFSKGNGKTGNVTNIINMEHKLINFCPDNWSNGHTDPSYHLPAFYEIWAETANDGREALYRELADNARAFLHKATDPNTGLNHDQCNYDGTSLWSSSEFHYDSWRVPMNIAMDFTWYHKDAEWQSGYAERIQNTIIGRYGLTTFPDQFAIDGGTPRNIMGGGNSQGKLRHSIGFVGTLATASLMTDSEYSQDLVRHMFGEELEPYEDGYYDVYYDGLIYLFALLHLSGNYRMSW